MLHQIGIGALGPVFRTYEPTRDRLVAVKVFRLDIVPEQAQTLATALTRATESSLFHPSIVEPIAAGMEGTVAYRAEEYVAAESLDVAMRHYAPAPLDKALPFLTQLAGAIDFARAGGIGHGGLHPRDIFLTPDEARATGFGVVEALEEVGVRAPTRRPYAAPERIAGATWSTPADVFSLAAIAFELLTGRRPSGTGEQIGALNDGPGAAAVHAVLARAMHDDPAQRFPTALAFAAALGGAARGDSAVASVPVAGPVVVPAVVGPADPLGAHDSPEPTLGEFAVEDELDPVLTAIDKDMIAEPTSGDLAKITVEHTLQDADHAERMRDGGIGAERTLFDDEDDAPAAGVADAPVRRDLASDVEAEALADAGEIEPERYADEFVEEQQAEAEGRRPLEAVHETIIEAADDPHAGIHDGASMFHTVDAEPARPAILPYALTAIVFLLAGFGLGSLRERIAARPGAGVDAPTAAAQPAVPAPTGAATPETPGQYSEQKVAPPPAAAPAGAPSSAAAPPPIPDETPAAVPAAPRAAAPRPAPVTRGRLVVRSTPPRAPVILNNKWRGRTPLTLDDLALGRYTVRIVQPGFAAARDEFTLSAADPSHEFTARLTPAPARERAAPPAPATRDAVEKFTGSIFVDSRPRGANVFLDGKPIGQTPLSMPDVSIGSHVVRFEMAGKKTWSTSTRVVAGQTSRVTGSLDDR